MINPLETQQAANVAETVAVVCGASSPGALMPILATLDPAEAALVLWRVDAHSWREAELQEVANHYGFTLQVASGDDVLERGRIYATFEDARVWFDARRLRVTAQPGPDVASLDRLLQSLARVWGSAGLVIGPSPLAAEDGELGLRAIYQSGGKVLHVADGAVGSMAMPKRRQRLHSLCDILTEPRPSRTPRGEKPTFRMQRLFPFPSAVFGRVRAAALIAARAAAPRGRVRAWVPRCRTGTLAYGIAMLLKEGAAEALPLPLVQVFGTDHDEEALAAARAGRYPVEAALNMDPALRGRYTYDEGETVRVAESLRELALFAPHRLGAQAPFSRMDLIVCHRVFDGMRPLMRDRIIDALYFALRDQGVLVALDHEHLFPEYLFERTPEGYLRPRPSHARTLRNRLHASSADAVARARAPGRAGTRAPGGGATRPRAMALASAEGSGQSAAFVFELAIARAVADAGDPRALGAGLARAFRAALGAAKLELWLPVTGEPRSWWRHYPEPGDVLEQPLHPSGWLPARGASYRARGKDGLPELWLPFYLTSSCQGVLRASGRELNPPDRSLRLCLERSARRVARALERLQALTLLRQREAEQRRRQAELEEILEALPVGISVHDQTGPILRQGSAFGSLGGATTPARSALAGGKPGDELCGWVKRVLRTGEPVQEVELVETSGPRERCYSYNIAPVRDARGEVWAAVAVAQDITSFKHIEAQLRAVDRQKDDFLAMLGHELRNPLAAIRNATELLSQAEAPGPAISHLQKILARQTLQTAKLIDGLLEMSRVARGKIELDTAPLALVPLVREAVEDRRHQFRDRVLDLRLPVQDVWLEADRTRLMQVIDNLLSNALKFTRTGGHVRVELAAENQEGCLTIMDDGVGIEPALLPWIFDAYRQGRPIMPEAQGGLGLGLSLVKGLVDLHGYRLEASSAGKGRGAEFRIHFPTVAAPPSRASRSSIEVRRMRLLVVEDNPDIAETLFELLGAAGHEVETVNTGEQALEQLRVRARAPDLVLCDIGLPGIDGIELARQLRADPALCGLELVAMTGYSDHRTRQSIIDVGFDDCLLKPVEPEALTQYLARLAS